MIANTVRLIMLGLPPVLLLAFAVPLFAAELPKIDFVYPSPDGTVFDRNCVANTGKAIPTGWIDETARRRPEFQRVWDQQGPNLLKVVFDEVREEFPYREMQATLTVCAVVGGSLSSPLLINVRGFMSGVPNPSPMWGFTLNVFHELMHHYTRDVYDKSYLRDKYSKELLVTRNHLHVLALEKFVLLKLGRRDDLAAIDKSYRNRDAADPYRRAWEIIDFEGYEAVINELKVGR